MSDETTEEIEREIDELPPEEKKVFYDEVQRVFGSEKIGNIHEFLTKVIQEKDTTKLGYLKQEELGNPLLTLRTYKALSIMAKQFDLPEFSQYFEDMATDVITSPSLSKDGFLLLLSITEKKQLAARLPSGQRKENRGWFGSKKQYPVSDYNY